MGNAMQTMRFSRLCALVLAATMVGVVDAADEPPADYSAYAQGLPSFLKKALFEIGACGCPECAMTCKASNSPETRWPPPGCRDGGVLCDPHAKPSQCCKWYKCRFGKGGIGRCYSDPGLEEQSSEATPLETQFIEPAEPKVDSSAVASPGPPIPPPPPVPQCDQWDKDQNACNGSGRCRFCTRKRCNSGRPVHCDGCTEETHCRDIDEECTGDDDGCGGGGGRRRRRRRKLSFLDEPVATKV